MSCLVRTVRAAYAVIMYVSTMHMHIWDSLCCLHSFLLSFLFLAHRMTECDGCRFAILSLASVGLVTLVASLNFEEAELKRSLKLRFHRQKQRISAEVIKVVCCLAQ